MDDKLGKAAAGDPPEDDDIPLTPRIREWIIRKTKTYHARKQSSRSVAQYRASMEYSAAERLEMCVQQHGLSMEEAENVVFQCLGKNSAAFHALIIQSLREREIRISAERDVQRARADATEPLIDAWREDRGKMMEFMESHTQMMQGMMNQLQNIAKLQITHQPSEKPEKKSVG